MFSFSSVDVDSFVLTMYWIYHKFQQRKLVILKSFCPFPSHSIFLYSMSVGHVLHFIGEFNVLSVLLERFLIKITLNNRVLLLYRLSKKREGLRFLSGISI